MPEQSTTDRIESCKLFAAADQMVLERHPNSIFPHSAIMYKMSASAEAQTSIVSIGLEAGGRSGEDRKFEAVEGANKRVHQ